jgi:hypothetical protein
MSGLWECSRQIWNENPNSEKFNFDVEKSKSCAIIVLAHVSLCHWTFMIAVHDNTLHQSNSSLQVFFPPFFIKQVDFWRCFDLGLELKVYFHLLTLSNGNISTP